MAKTYKIGEAASLLNLKTYVLRFWETEFPDIVPLRTEKGQRLYTEDNIALLERIRFLLHERGLTIEGARKALLEDKARGMLYVFPAGSPEAGSPEAALDNDPKEGGGQGGYAPVEDPEVPDAPDADDSPLRADGEAVSMFFSQYNLPGIAKAYPIHEPPLFEDRGSTLLGYGGIPDGTAQALPRAFAAQESGTIEGESISASPKDRSDKELFALAEALHRHKETSRAFLDELTEELHAIIELLRRD